MTQLAPKVIKTLSCNERHKFMGGIPQKEISMNARKLRQVVLIALKISFIFIIIGGMVMPQSNVHAATLCVNTAGTGGCYATIQSAIDAANPGDTINIEPGNYSGNINITKSLTLTSTSSAADTTISGIGSAAIRISADNVVIEGFTITNPSGTNAIVSADHSHITIRNNIITDIKATAAPGNVHAIAIVSSSADVDDILIENNQIYNIASLGTTSDSSSSTGQRGYSASAINIGWTTGTHDVTGLVIQNNTISNIKSNTDEWKSGHGAYGILLSHGTSGGKTVGAQILNNSITYLDGLWAHGIGLEGDTPNAIIQGNTISYLTHHKDPSTPDAAAIMFESNPSAGTVTVRANRLTNSAIGITNVTGEAIDAQYNYWENLAYPVVNYPTTGSVNTSSECGTAPCFPFVVLGSNTMPSNGAILANGPAKIFVEFNESVTSASAEDRSNYILVEAGTNGIVDTTSCTVPGSGSAAPDDVKIAIDSVTYDNSDPFIATINVNGGVPLPPGKYSLFICGTTSIENSFNIHLNNGLLDTILNFTVRASDPSLPQTGFPVGRVTTLAKQPAEKAYANTAMSLVIPKLGVTTSIVGVPQTEDSWDVSWLGESAGWLQGSAFPTWAGNTVLTAHVWNADNTPGPFLHIKDLHYGDQIEIHAWGETYVYEVRENRLYWAKTPASRVLQHEEYDVLTLLTCEGFNPLTDNYIFRRMVRAVLVEVK